MRLVALAHQARLDNTLAHRIEDREPGIENRFLRHVADAQALRLLQQSVVELFEARNHLQQRRLAGAVAADQANALARLERERRAVEQGDVAIRKMRPRERKNRHDNAARGATQARGSFERVDEHRRDVEARLIADFLKAGRTGDVDLGQAVADDVEPDQQQATGSERRADALGDLAVARRDRLRHTLAAGGEVATDLAPLRNARRHEGRGLAGDDEHALVAAYDLGQVALRHHGVAAARVQRLDDDAEVHAVGADAKDAGAAHAIHRLVDDVAVLGVEARDSSAARVTARRADELRELENGELFRMIAQRRRLIEDARQPSRSALPLEQVRRVEVLAVERRVLAHQDGIEIGEGDARPAQRAGQLPAASRNQTGLAAGERDRAHVRGDLRAALPHQGPRPPAGEERVAAPRGFAHHREGGVLLDVEALQRVGDEEKSHGEREFGRG